MLGRILRSTATTFTFGRTLNASDIPAFGQLVKAELPNGEVFGLIYEIIIEDDPFVRQVVAASADMSAEKVEDMRQRRQAPVAITALAIASRQRGRLVHGVPPRPPAALQPILPCDCAETRDVLGDFAFFRRILDHAQCPSDDLLTAGLLQGAGCQAPGQDRPYLLAAGRELVRLLAQEPARLNALLHRLAIQVEASRE